MCYGCQATHLQARVPNGQTWVIVGTMIETLLLVVNQCILNQSNGFGCCLMHWLMPLPWFPTCRKKSMQWRPFFNL